MTLQAPADRTAVGVGGDRRLQSRPDLPRAFGIPGSAPPPPPRVCVMAPLNRRNPPPTLPKAPRPTVWEASSHGPGPPSPAGPVLLLSPGCWWWLLSRWQTWFPEAGTVVDRRASQVQRALSLPPGESASSQHPATPPPFLRAPPLNHSQAPVAGAEAGS